MGGVFISSSIYKKAPFGTAIVVGFTEAQADVQAETMRELINEQLVTKGYLDMRIKELELKLTQQIKELELKIESTKAETIKWVAAMLVAQAALIASMVKLIH